MDIDIRKIFAANDAALARGALSMWTVYDHPADFPHSYVARRFEISNGSATPTGDIVQGELSIIRIGFQHCGMVCLMRNEEDDPKIIETWL
ncbi:MULTISPECIES: hypothetical protein [unclassified Bradyrhizobium]|uniref:hypothetical protein n=1 Tax=unclassified Bradyrhizobium TaxID=2631580 RepID=UPI002FF2F5B9